MHDLFGIEMLRVGIPIFFLLGIARKVLKYLVQISFAFVENGFIAQYFDMTALRGKGIGDHWLAFNREFATRKSKTLSNAARMQHAIAGINKLNFVM